MTWLRPLGLTFVLVLAMPVAHGQAQDAEVNDSEEQEAPLTPVNGRLRDANAPAADATKSGKPLWELGLGAVVVDQQAFPGSSARVKRGLATPYFIYRGRVLRAADGTLGLRAIRNPRYQLDIGAAGAFGSGANVPLREGMPTIGSLGEFGPRLKIRLGSLQGPRWPWSLQLPLRVVFNLSRQFRYTGVAFEPKLVYARRVSRAVSFSANASMLFVDHKLANTFYGVDSQYETAARPSYQARAGFSSTRLGASLTYRFNRYWALTGFARIDDVNGSANRRSPLVDQLTGHTIGVRISWTAAESIERGAR